MPPHPLTATRLTALSHGAGCACKLGPSELAQVLTHIPVATDPRILVDAVSTYWTVVAEFETESLTTFEKEMETYGSDEEMGALISWLQKQKAPAKASSR